MTNDLNWISATKLAKLFSKGKASPVEAAKGCLAHISRHDRALNAMCLVDEKSALKQARASEKRWKQGEQLGHLDGVPALIKDILLVKGWPTLRGSKTVDPTQKWVNDAPSVARLREAGAVLTQKHAAGARVDRIRPCRAFSRTSGPKGRPGASEPG